MWKSTILGIFPLFSASTMFGATIYLTNTANSLLRIDSATPGVIAASVGISGLQSGENLVGIDFRPFNGVLYGIGSTSRIYSLNVTTGAATQIGSAGLFTLSGTNFGIDFNPVPDRIRVTSNTGQNLRLNPNDGTLSVTDTPLAYAVGDVNAGQTPGVVASAYTNSFAGATSTTLYDIDVARGVLAVQNPPNNGTLTTIGNLGVFSTNQVGFDILGGAGTAFASFTNQGGISSLYTINLATGAATLVGGIGTGQTITGLAAVSDVPEPGTLSLLVVGAAAAFLAKRKR